MSREEERSRSECEGESDTEINKIVSDKIVLDKNIENGDKIEENGDKIEENGDRIEENGDVPQKTQADENEPNGIASQGEKNQGPPLVNRRRKIVNGFFEKGDRATKGRSRRIVRKGRDSQGSDSGVGESETEPSRAGKGAEKTYRNGRTSQASKKDEMTRLEKELEQEMRYRDTIQWSVTVLQQSVDELSKQLESVKEGGQEEVSGSEFKLRYEAQKRLNAKLEEQTEWYQGEVNKTREKMKRGQEFTFDQDLDQYNEFELLRMVKSLERERNNLYSDLRGKMWILDNQSKEYYHLKELIRAYTGDLTMVNRSLEHLWKQQTLTQESAFTGGSTPVTSPGGVKWSRFLDAIRDESGQSGIRPSHRILDPRKGPIRKTAGVRSLPRLDQEALDHYNSGGLFRKGRSRSRGHGNVRAKSLDTRKDETNPPEVIAPLSPVHRAKSEEGNSQRSSSGVFDESYEASNEASTTASVETGSDKL